MTPFNGLHIPKILQQYIDASVQPYLQDGYKYYIFTSDGYIRSVGQDVRATALLVGGGGGGGVGKSIETILGAGGGGGCGQVIQSQNLSLRHDVNVVITIGAGGAGGQPGREPESGRNGGNTIIRQIGGSTFTAVGGAGGGASNTSDLHGVESVGLLAGGGGGGCIYQTAAGRGGRGAHRGMDALAYKRRNYSGAGGADGSQTFNGGPGLRPVFPSPSYQSRIAGGGPGVDLDNLVYGTIGGGSRQGEDAYENTGAGGAAGSFDVTGNASGYRGGSGLVIIRVVA